VCNAGASNAGRSLCIQIAGERSYPCQYIDTTRKASNSSLYATGPLSCLSCLSVTLVCCGQTVGWIKMKLSVEVGLGHIVLDGDQAPPPPKKRVIASTFSAHVLCPNDWTDQNATWYGGSLGQGDFVLHGDPASPKKGHSPQFSTHAYYSQTAGWIKMPLGIEVGLCPGDIVLDGDPTPPKGHSPLPTEAVAGP